MKVTLYHRRHGVYDLRKEADLPGDFGDYATPGRPARPNEIAEHWTVDEDKLLAALPAGFLPVKPGAILLTVSDENGGTGQVGLTVFRNFAKYFDAYILDLAKPAGQIASHALDGVLGRTAAR